MVKGSFGLCEVSMREGSMQGSLGYLFIILVEDAVVLAALILFSTEASAML